MASAYFTSKKPAVMIGVIATLTLFSCSLPLFKGVAPGSSTSNSSSDKNGKAKSSRLSGILNLSEGCERGYYQVKLQGMLENASIQVESQTDSSGRFSLVAPAGQYLMMVTKENCGSKDPIELSENTEHMLAVSVHEIKSVEKLEKNWGRIPASILVEMKKARSSL